jgi:molybdopterin-guanine dinucleotide biosynthesis protein A
MSRALLGAIIAGGLSTRYGAPKALAEVGGRRVVDRVAAVLRSTATVEDVVVIANDAQLGHAIGLPFRGDVLQAGGALAGVHAALLWALERGRAGIIAVACDMPFLEPALIDAIAARADAAEAVLPESAGPRGVEPLCAFYSTVCIAPIEAAAARGDMRMIGFHADCTVERVPLDVVRSIGDPAVLFRNLNTPADRLAADRIAAGLSAQERRPQ